MDFKIYLGDSVYCEYEHGMFKLTTENGTPIDPTNMIFLGWEEMKSLRLYQDRILELIEEHKEPDQEKDEN